MTKIFNENSNRKSENERQRIEEEKFDSNECKTVEETEEEKR